MYKESFATLIEIRSLHRHVMESQQIVEKHQKRLSDFQQKIDECSMLITDTKTDLLGRQKERLAQENSYSMLEQSQTKTTNHLEVATNNQQVTACEKELATIKNEMEQLEDNILETLEQEDEWTERITTKTEEESGLSKSIKNIESEVLQDTTSEQHIIVGYNERITQLESELTPVVLNAYQNLMSNFTAPFSFIEKQKCTECFIQVPANVEQQVNTCNNLEYCSNCGRLFLVK